MVYDPHGSWVYRHLYMRFEPSQSGFCIGEVDQFPAFSDESFKHGAFWLLYVKRTEAEEVEPFCFDEVGWPLRKIKCCTLETADQCHGQKCQYSVIRIRYHSYTVRPQGITSVMGALCPSARERAEPRRYSTPIKGSEYRVCNCEHEHWRRKDMIAAHQKKQREQEEAAKRRREREAYLQEIRTSTNRKLLIKISAEEDDKELRFVALLRLDELPKNP
jgi:hypothetical protein